MNTSNKILRVIFFCFVLTNVSAQSTLPQVQIPVFKTRVFNIISYGAKNDGITLNTASITDAINDCNKNGGGVVNVPSGFWLTGPIVLKSNVNLHLEKNSILQFTKDFDQYPLVKGNWEGVPQMRNQSPISANNETNIGITGEGIIDGNGDAWRMVKKDKLNETQWKKLITSGGIVSEDKKTWYPTEKSLNGSKLKNPGEISDEKNDEYYSRIKDFLRPNMIVLNGCKRVLLEGVTFQNSPAWNIHPLKCEDLTVRNIYAKNPWYAQNGDGIDVESCKNVIIENSTFDVGDDGICIKSGKDAAGRKRGIPTEDLLVKNCTVYHAHGGFVIGSEMSGGAKNLFVEHCTFIGTDIGLRFKTTRGRGGVVENIFINDINMKDILGEAILFDMYYAAQDPVPLDGEKREQPKEELLPVNEGTPLFRNFHVKNIVCNGAAKAVFIRGLPEMHIENVDIENMTVQSIKGVEIIEASGINLININLLTQNTDPVISILNSNDVSFKSLTYPKKSQLLFRLEGGRTKNISISNTPILDVKQQVKFGNNIGQEVFKIK